MIGGMSDLTIPEEDVPHHDPLCPGWPVLGAGPLLGPAETKIEDAADCSLCALIARVREDERVKSTPVRWVQQAVDAAKEARNAALRDAIDAVSKLPSAWTSDAYREKVLGTIKKLKVEK